MDITFSADVEYFHSDEQIKNNASCDNLYDSKKRKRTPSGDGGTKQRILAYQDKSGDDDHRVIAQKTLKLRTAKLIALCKNNKFLNRAYISTLNRHKAAISSGIQEMITHGENGNYMGYTQSCISLIRWFVASEEYQGSQEAPLSHRLQAIKHLPKRLAQEVSIIGWLETKANSLHREDPHFWTVINLLKLHAPDRMASVLASLLARLEAPQERLTFLEGLAKSYLLTEDAVLAIESIARSSGEDISSDLRAQAIVLKLNYVLTHKWERYNYQDNLITGYFLADDAILSEVGKYRLNQEVRDYFIEKLTHIIHTPKTYSLEDRLNAFSFIALFGDKGIEPYYNDLTALPNTPGITHKERIRWVHLMLDARYFCAAIEVLNTIICKTPDFEEALEACFILFKRCQNFKKRRQLVLPAIKDAFNETQDLTLLNQSMQMAASVMSKKELRLMFQQYIKDPAHSPDLVNAAIYFILVNVKDQPKSLRTHWELMLKTVSNHRFLEEESTATLIRIWKEHPLIAAAYQEGLAASTLSAEEIPKCLEILVEGGLTIRRAFQVLMHACKDGETITEAALVLKDNQCLRVSNVIQLRNWLDESLSSFIQRKSLEWLVTNNDEKSLEVFLQSHVDPTCITYSQIEALANEALSQKYYSLAGSWYLKILKSPQESDPFRCDRVALKIVKNARFAASLRSDAASYLWQRSQDVNLTADHVFDHVITPLFQNGFFTNEIFDRLFAYASNDVILLKNIFHEILNQAHRYSFGIRLFSDKCISFIAQSVLQSTRPELINAALSHAFQKTTGELLYLLDKLKPLLPSSGPLLNLYKRYDLWREYFTFVHEGRFHQAFSLALKTFWDNGSQRIYMASMFRYAFREAIKQSVAIPDELKHVYVKVVKQTSRADGFNKYKETALKLFETHLKSLQEKASKNISGCYVNPTLFIEDPLHDLWSASLYDFGLVESLPTVCQRARSRLINHFSKLEECSSSEGREELSKNVRQFIQRLHKDNKDASFDPQETAMRISAVTANILSIGGHNGPLTTLEATVLRRFLDVIADHALACVDRASVGLGKLELEVLCHLYQDRFDILLSIALCVGKQHRLMGNALEDQDSKYLNGADEIENYLSLLTTFSHFFDMGYLGKTMRFTGAISNDRPFNQVFKSLLSMAVEDLIHYMVDYSLGHDSLRAALFRQVGIPVTLLSDKEKHNIYASLEALYEALREGSDDADPEALFVQTFSPYYQSNPMIENQLRFWIFDPSSEYVQQNAFSEEDLMNGHTVGIKLVEEIAYFLKTPYTDRDLQEVKTRILEGLKIQGYIIPGSQVHKCTLPMRLSAAQEARPILLHSSEVMQL